MAEKRAISKGLWVPIHKPKRGGEWINWLYIRSTRKAAKDALLEGVNPEYKKQVLENVRFARVTITEDDHA